MQAGRQVTWPHLVPGQLADDELKRVAEEDDVGVEQHRVEAEERETAEVHLPHQPLRADRVGHRTL